MVVLTPPMERGPRSMNSTFVVLENTAKTETGFKTNFLLMKNENSITSYCVVLMFKSSKIQLLIKEILVFWSIGSYILFMDDDSENKTDDSDDGLVFDSE